ncbi:metal ABC transporter ATP-binding protein [Nakamurella endophytica]
MVGTPLATVDTDPVPAQPSASPRGAVVELADAELTYGARVLWTHLDLSIRRGEFVAVLGANGSGKTSLLRVLLGQQPLRHGSARIAGAPVRRGSGLVGYVPQRVAIDAAAAVRVRDLVRLGVDGHRWGPPFTVGAARRRLRDTVDRLLADVGAAHLADVPVAQLSGGELQRVRVAQALATDPLLLLCDEPLAALDPAHQQEVAALIDRRRRDRDTAVLFVTHEVNAVIDYVDQVLYLAEGRWALGPPSEVMTSERLSELYQAPVDVIQAHGRLVVVAASDMAAGLHQSWDDHLPHPPDAHDHGRHDPLATQGWRR